MNGVNCISICRLLCTPLSGVFVLVSERNCFDEIHFTLRKSSLSKGVQKRTESTFSQNRPLRSCGQKGESAKKTPSSENQSQPCRNYCLQKNRRCGTAKPCQTNYPGGIPSASEKLQGQDGIFGSHRGKGIYRGSKIHRYLS